MLIMEQIFLHKVTDKDMLEELFKWYITTQAFKLVKAEVLSLDLDQVHNAWSRTYTWDSLDWVGLNSSAQIALWQIVSHARSLFPVGSVGSVGEIEFIDW